jgi:hypothetical protein
LLAKVDLAQFTARLFCRSADDRHLAVNIFDSLSPHTVAGSFTRPIYTVRHTNFPGQISNYGNGDNDGGNARDGAPCRRA